MPSVSSSERVNAPAVHDDLDNYHVDDFSDDPFASPGPRDSKSKRKLEREDSGDGVGIDKEVSVQKRARGPNVKLDENRLLEADGIPRLRARARGLQIKGKGHEFSDAERLLSFYQFWLHDLFPKARFLDALAMVEKVGHKKRVMAARNEWISEAQRSDQTGEDEGADWVQQPAANHPRDYRPDHHQQDERPSGGSKGPATPLRPHAANYDGMPDEEDEIYRATPRQRKSTRRFSHLADVHDEEDDLSALIAEAETHDQPAVQDERQSSSKPVGDAEPEEDELDALMADAEAHEGETRRQSRRQDRENSPAGLEEEHRRDEFADEEAAMQELEGLW